jgi:hypothetical protein
MAVFPSQDNGAAGRTDAVRAETVLESDALSSESIDMRRFIDPTSITTHGVCSMVIRHDKDNIRSGCDNFIGFLTGRGKHKNNTDCRDE